MIISIQVAILIGLMAASAFFSSAETTFFSLDPLAVRRIDQRHPAVGARLHELLSRPTHLLSTLLIGNTVVNVGIAALAYTIAEQYAPGRGAAIAIPATTIVLIVFGEFGPKRAGLALAETLVRYYTPPMRVLIVLLGPFRWVLERLTQTLEPLFRPRRRTLSQEEFETVLDIGGEEGIINADELAMIKAISRLEDLRASDVMTPRVDLIGLDLAEDAGGYVERARSARRNHLVLYREGLDYIEGFLDVRQFLLDPEYRFERAAVPPFFVPENSPLSKVLDQMQQERRRIAVVVDEYGGTAGVITRGDILEEITGDIYTELNKPRPLFQEVGPNRWLVDANASLEELNRKLHLDLEAEDADRLAGWIAAHAGHMPRQGDVVEAQGCRVTVLQTLRLRVTLAQVEKLEAAE